MTGLYREPPGGAASVVLTTEGLLVELYKVGEDVFRDCLLIWQTLEQNDNLRLADSVHAFGRHVPALPVYVCWGGGQKTCQDVVTAIQSIFFQQE